MNIERDQKFSRIIDSNGTFTDANHGIKNDYIQSKQSLLEKQLKFNHSKSLEEDIKSETRERTSI